MVQALRDLEAAKGRVDRDAKRVLDETREQLVAKLLPVLDDLDRTIRAAVENGDAPAVLDGVRLVRSQLEGILRGYGAERIDAKDQAFDPKRHEAVSMIAVTDPRGTVACSSRSRPATGSATGCCARPGSWSAATTPPAIRAPRYY